MLGVRDRIGSNTGEKALRAEVAIFSGALRREHARHETATWLLLDKDAMIVAIIPARGGSARIPRKNIRPFAGKPIIGYSIAAARECNLFDRIIVSTDDAEIAAVARDCGAETPFVRPPELSDDHTGTNEVAAHALVWLAERGQAAEVACCIYVTAPFILPSDLRRGYEELVRGVDRHREKLRFFSHHIRIRYSASYPACSR
jgi:hypothetical protein